jgi:hypothetical protein
MKRLAVLILLASCARQSPTALPVAVPSPPGPERCQEGVPVPPSPRAPRTVEQLGDWAIRAERAARQTEHARSECALDYARLRTWLSETR